METKQNPADESYDPGSGKEHDRESGFGPHSARWVLEAAAANTASYSTGALRVSLRRRRAAAVAWTSNFHPRR